MFEFPIGISQRHFFLIETKLELISLILCNFKNWKCSLSEDGVDAHAGIIPSERTDEMETERTIPISEIVVNQIMNRIKVGIPCGLDSTVFHPHHKKSHSFFFGRNFEFSTELEWNTISLSEFSRYCR